MNRDPIGQAIKTEMAGITCSTCVVAETESGLLTRVAAWVTARNLPFLVTSIGMIVKLLWAGAFKMTRPGPKKSDFPKFIELRRNLSSLSNSNGYCSSQVM